MTSLHPTRRPDGRGRGLSELARAMAGFRAAFVSVAAMSGVLNVLALSGSMFMLLVYDQVIPSHSLPTLVGLVLLVAVLYAFQAVIEQMRARILVRIGCSLDLAMSGRVYETLGRLSLMTRGTGDGLQPVRDLDQVRSFLSGPGLPAFFDLPWMVLYLGICFAFHVLIGVTALAGAILLVALTLLTEVLSREPVRRTAALAASRNALASTNRQSAEAIRALGMESRLQARWRALNQDYLRTQQRAADVTGGLSSLTRVLRLMLQSGVLAVGAYLVLEQKATGGIIIASSILTSRALAPVELSIANWRGFTAARQSWTRLTSLLDRFPQDPDRTELPPPARSLSVEAVSVVPPDAKALAVQDVSFALQAGQVLGVIGPSASGKSSLVRAIVGVWRPVRGQIRLDGATLDQWDPDALGASLGYVPQDVELLFGTVAENIARFEPDAPAEAVIAAARQADVHEMILRLPQGYETPVGENGAALSAGQRQRIALARALYRDPFLLVLDEPNSNLDAEGEQALSRAVVGAKARGAVVVMVAHRPSALAAIDLVLLIRDGRVQAFGPRDEVLSKLLPPQAGPRPVGARAK